MPKWTKDMELGIGVLDLDHKQLVTLLGLIEEAIPLLPSPVADMLADRMVRETDEHLRREEEILMANDLPGWEDHCHDHRVFSEIAHQLPAAVRAADQGRVRALVQQMRQMFSDRLLPADHELFAQLQQRSG